MDKIRQAIIDHLKGKFPSMENSILAYTGMLDEDSDEQISYQAPAILVCVLPIQEVPENIAPWELQAEIGLVVAMKAPGALERDKLGWDLTIKVAKECYRKTWGISPEFIRPSIITGIAKVERRNRDNTPSGLDYWTITFYNWLKFEGIVS